MSKPKSLQCKTLQIQKEFIRSNQGVLSELIMHGSVETETPDGHANLMKGQGLTFSFFTLCLSCTGFSLQQ